jgi:hypothetical protein
MSQSRFLQEEYSKKIRQTVNNVAINVAIADLVAAQKARHSDGSKWLSKSSQSYQHTIALLQPVGVKITYNALMKRVSRALLGDRAMAEITLTNSPEQSVVSSPLPHKRADDSLNDSLTSESEDTDEIKHKSLAGGRPKGSTNTKKKQNLSDASKCTDAIIFEYSRKYNASKSVGGKVKYGYLKRLIDEKKKEFGVNCSIPISTIKNCVYAGALTTHHRAKSPLDKVEEALVQICIQMGKICQPLSCTEAIALMNDMVENTKTKQKLIEFHDSRKLGTYGFEKGQVTTGWWRGFLRRRKDKLVTKRGEKIALNRSDWATLPNIWQMYKVIYNEMVDANVAVALENSIFTDINGKPEDHETKRFGLGQNIKITKPEWILFADEIGFITSQKKDEKFVVERGTNPQTMSSTQITNLPCSHSLLHLARQFVVQSFFREKAMFQPPGGLALIIASLQF